MKPRIPLAVLFSALAASLASAQVPAGGEFQINTYIAWNQWVSSIAADASGAFVVAWTSDTQDGSGYGVFAQNFAASGAPIGSEFLVNAYTSGRQVAPAVAADAVGNFVIAWMSDGQDGSGRGAFARRYDRTGAPLGSEFQVNAYTTGGQGEASVAFDSARNLVIAWAGQGAGDDYGVFVRRYDATGATRGPEFRVNSYTTGDQWGPSVATVPSGGFVVAWTSTRGWDVGQFGIMARRYDATGSPIGPDFRVHTPDPWNMWFSQPAVAADAAGNFVVVWSRVDYWPPLAPSSKARGPGESGVFGQRFDASGAPLGAQFAVVTSFLNDHNTSVASDPVGDFVVAWDHQADGSGSGVFARRYDASGAPRGQQFRINSTIPYDQLTPQIASDSAGNLMAAWTSNQQDGDEYGVFGQRIGGILPAALAVDTVPAGSDGNRVLEPGESVDVRPSWRNANGVAQMFDGVGVSFTGPPGPGVGYQMADATGAYGNVPDGATTECADCYRVDVAFAGMRPATHWDANFTERLTPDVLGQTKPWSLHVGQSFADVPKTSLFYRDVETLLHRGITGGCAAAQYCPASPVTRDQMAAFVLPAKEGAGYRPQPCSPPNLFADVPETSLFCDVIEELARRAVVGGCGGGNYCPAAAVTREQMPVFVLRLLNPTLDPPPCTTPMFADVPAGNPFCRWIEELARRGVVGGCGGGNYCPASPVTREEMAVFLAGTYGLGLYGP